MTSKLRLVKLREAPRFSGCLWRQLAAGRRRRQAAGAVRMHGIVDGEKLSHCALDSTQPAQACAAAVCSNAFCWQRAMGTWADPDPFVHVSAESSQISVYEARARPGHKTRVSWAVQEQQPPDTDPVSQRRTQQEAHPTTGPTSLKGAIEQRCSNSDAALIVVPSPSRRLAEQRLYRRGARGLTVGNGQHGFLFWRAAVRGELPRLATAF